MLAAFVGEAQLRELRSYMEHKQDPHTRHQDFSDQLLSLSPSMFDHFKNGRVSVTARVRKSSVRSTLLPIWCRSNMILAPMLSGCP